MAGTLYGVGIGPGDPELITQKAVRIIGRSKVVAVPKSGDGKRVALNITRQAVLDLDTKLILELDMPMTKDTELLRNAHSAAAEKIIGYLKQDIDVSFLTLGDPTIYSTYIYVHRIVKEKGYSAEIIPGVTSFCAVAAKLGDALVETSEPLHIIPGSYGNLRENLKMDGTKVLMKSGKAFASVKAELKAMDLLSNAKMVVNCGMDNEIIVEKIEDNTESSGYFSIIVVKEKAD